MVPCFKAPRERDTVGVLHTVRSRWPLSRRLTARMTPDLHDQRETSPAAGGPSPLTQRKRFPTSSGRASAAIAPPPPAPPPAAKLPKGDAFTSLSFGTPTQGIRWKERKSRNKSCERNGAEGDPGALNVLRPPPARASPSSYPTEKTHWTALPPCLSAGSLQVHRP